MNRKPSWGLWLLMIVAPVAVFFGVRYWKQLPPIFPLLDRDAKEMAAQGTPLVGDVQLRLGSNSKSYDANFVLCNPTRDKLTVDVVVVSGASELLKYPKGAPAVVHDGESIIRWNVGNGVLWFGIVEVKRNRTKPIRFNLNWKHGADSGVKNAVITPQMKP